MKHWDTAAILRSGRLFRSAFASVILLTAVACGHGSDSLPETGFTDADYERHAAELKLNYARDGFTVVVQRPFVVIGDAEEQEVKDYARQTIDWAVRMLKQDYFEKDPNDIIDIWLFKNDSSYTINARQIFGADPISPFGYYLEDKKSLVMNIATGGGTLVHEIVHPFIQANFPQCPPWFNEGLASLYEQCGEKNGHIVGYTNWRLAGLKTAIKTGKVPAFKKLLSLDETDFYTRDKGTNYGQARYLCYFLQEKGKLVDFYRKFRAHQAQDPTGYQTLKSILGIKDMLKFKKNWEKFVLGLTFP